jgi:hypothetical protein
VVSIPFASLVRYGFAVVRTTLLAALARSGLYRHRLFATRDARRGAAAVTK